nr:immunoglobulin light chain junction region [Macaca mulatta]MOW29834.1 immunoglobulin light chain junction region [Macaca mulatta]
DYYCSSYTNNSTWVF